MLLFAVQIRLVTIITYHHTINKNNSHFSKDSIKLLGYSIGNIVLKPDEDDQELLVPFVAASLQCAIGMFAYYAKSGFQISPEK